MDDPTLGDDYFHLINTTLYTAVLSDVLDSLGLRYQVLDSGIRPLVPQSRLAGRAYPVLVMDVYEDPKRPYAKLIEALDRIRPHEVFMANASSGRSAFWGELLTTACLARGAHGAVIDGLTRDSARIMQMNFPVYARGLSPVDSKGRNDVVAYGVPIECGGVKIRPGDLVVADGDGIVIVPKESEAEVIRLATEKTQGENLVREGLRQGLGIQELYDRYGVL